MPLRAILFFTSAIAAAAFSSVGPGVPQWPCRAASLSGRPYAPRGCAMSNLQRCVAPLQLGDGHRGASGRGLRSAPRSSAARIALRSKEDGGRGDRVDKAAASERDLAFYEELMSCSGDAELEAGIRSALSVLSDALRLYGHERCRVSFNGGKDADVILHLMRAALAKHKEEEASVPKDVRPQLVRRAPQPPGLPARGEGGHRRLTARWRPQVYFEDPEEFPEVTAHVAETVAPSSGGATDRLLPTLGVQRVACPDAQEPWLTWRRGQPSRLRPTPWTCGATRRTCAPRCAPSSPRARARSRLCSGRAAGTPTAASRARLRRPRLTCLPSCA
jgi:hypothetical protein